MKQKRGSNPPFLLFYSMTSVVLVVVLLILGSFFKGKMDKAMFREHNSDWKKKWKTTSTGKLLRYNGKDWYYFGFYPTFKERFTYSSTILVFLTDSWHKYQFLFLRCVYLAIAIGMVGSYCSLLLAFVVFPMLYGIGFYFGFEKYRKI